MTLFDQQDHSVDRGGLMERMPPFVAPVAADAGAVTDDPKALDLADAVYEAFGDSSAAGGLTRAQIAHACRDVCPDPASFDSRFDLFCRLRMLTRISAQLVRRKGVS